MKEDEDDRVQCGCLPREGISPEELQEFRCNHVIYTDTLTANKFAVVQTPFNGVSQKSGNLLDKFEFCTRQLVYIKERGDPSSQNRNYQSLGADALKKKNKKNSI